MQCIRCKIRKHVKSPLNDVNECVSMARHLFVDFVIDMKCHAISCYVNSPNDGADAVVA